MPVTGSASAYKEHDLVGQSRYAHFVRIKLVCANKEYAYNENLLYSVVLACECNCIACEMGAHGIWPQSVAELHRKIDRPSAYCSLRYQRREKVLAGILRISKSTPGKSFTAGKTKPT